jgi:hypothetical protein
MAFNTWTFGSAVDDGLAKIAKHISFIQPDIVALQVPSFFLLDNPNKSLLPIGSH